MGTLRKFNTSTNTWEAIATSDANAIKVTAPELLPEGYVSTNVENVLQSMHEDIKTLKGNVSWLAKYGGGGTGGSGGGSSNQTEGSITINDLQSGSSIVFEDELVVKVKVSDSRLKWEIVAYAGSKMVKYVSSGTSITITKADLKKQGIDKSFTLSVTAFNSDTFTSLYWDGQIILSNVSFYTDASTSFEFDINLDKAITYYYDVGISGNYYFYVNNVLITGSAINLATLSGSINVSLKELMNSDSPLQPGINTLEARLINVNNENVQNSFVSQIILTTNEPIIYQNTLSNNLESPNEVQVYSPSITISIPFNVYYSGTTYVYYITCSKQTESGWEALDTNTWGITYTQYNKENSNASYFIDQSLLELDKIYKITIHIKDTITYNQYQESRYIKLVTPELGLLKTRTDKHKIFEFCTFNGEIKNGNWLSASNVSDTVYQLQIQNLNSKNQDVNAETKSLRFQNASYAKINFDTAVVSTNKEFTLHICYKPDYHPDIDRTVLQWNDLGNPSSKGILLKNKSLYIFTNQIIQLEEKEILDITITYKPENANGDNGTVFVYLDGVIEAVIQASYEQIVPELLKDFYIAASCNSDGSFDYTDMNMYNLSMYNVCLSPFDVLINRLNNQARTNLKNGIPDTSYISQGLQRNFLTADDTGTKITSSILYKLSKDPLTNEILEDPQFNNNATSNSDSGILNSYFSVSNFIDANTSKLREDIKNFSIPIPILYINVDKESSWTWSKFIAPQTNETKLPEVSAQVEYYDQNQDARFIYQLNNVTVKPQGTSTLADYIKNLDITFEEGTVFSPKDTWFPEQTYTLKADIVDSSHSLNTSIGKFVNQELGDINNTYYPFSETVRSNFVNNRDKEHFPNATLKHGVEGFPVLVIMKYYKENPDEQSVHSLGIYQFILGRKSPRNLGYEIITGISNTSGEELAPFTYPLYRENIKLNTKSIKGYWLEYGLNESIPDDVDLQSIQTQYDVNNSKLTGAFWQSDPNYYNTSVEIKYSNLGTEQASNPSQILPFMQFVNNVQKLPITVKRYSDSDGLQRVTIGNGMTYKKYSYEKNNSGSYVWKQTDDVITTATRGDDLQSVVSQLNIESISKFFVIAMLFGLLDNFQKNLPFKFYLNNNNDWETPLLGIYDTDSGLGQSNQAQQNVSESLWISGLSNTDTDFYESKTGPNSTIIATSNKLWYLDSKDLNYAMGNGENDGGSIYATQWNALKAVFKQKNISVDDLAEYYWKNYFLPQTQGCGELLFNLTYIAKYITEYSINSSTAVNQINKLHGRRVYQVKNWLTQRVKFLDSMFNAMGLTSNAGSPVDEIKSTAINAALGPHLKVTTNAPVIVRYANQGTASRYIFCDKNQPQNVYFGSESLDTSDYDKSHILYNSDSIIKIGEGDNPLYDIGFSTINTGQLPYLTEYNVSAPNKSSSNKNGLAAMDSNYMYSKFTKDGISELRTIDFRNTYPAKNVSSYVLNLTNGFDKLQKLYINNGCITDIQFPRDVSLQDFNISGSNLISLDLDNQNFITSLDLTNCYELQSVKITNCSNLKIINIDNTTKKLNKFELSSNGLETFECRNNSVKEIQLTSTNLKSVLIRSNSLQSLTIQGNINLTSIDISSCPNLTTLRIPIGSSEDVSNVTTLKLNNTKVKSLDQGDVLNLVNFVKLQDFNIQSNTAVTKIQFANIQNNPIQLNNSFSGCSNLERVYGHIAPTCTNVFNKCTKFKLHGNTYNDINVLSGKKYKTCLKNTTDFKDDDYILLKFQAGNNVTNLNLDYKTNLNSDFAYTSCTAFDVYYVLASLNSDKEYTLNGTFSYITDLFVWNATVDNSPSRYTFQYNSTNITDLTSCFSGSCNMIKIFSPIKDSEGNFQSDKSTWGFFTFLENCTNINTMFYASSIIIDTNVFRHPTKDFKISNMTFFNPRIIVDDVKNWKRCDITLDSIQTAGNDITKCGNLSGFFINLPNLVAISNCFETYFINYVGKWYLNAQRVTQSFYSSFAVGQLVLSGNIFNQPQYVTDINTSFRISWDIHTSIDALENAKFIINSNTLSDFVSLQYIQTPDSTRLSGPFTGFSKIIENEFPIDIVEKCKNLVKFEEFFKNCEYINSSNSTLQLPQGMFKNNTKLQSVAGLFYNLGCQYELTANGFEKCTQLDNVSYLFGFDNKIKKPNEGLIGSIPYKLFYHGQYNQTKTFTGINGEIEETVDGDVVKRIIRKRNSDESYTQYYQLQSALGNKFYSQLNEGSDVYGYDSMYQINASDIYETISVDGKIPYKTISQMQNCFAKSNLDYYVATELEDGVFNEDYNPFDYNYNSGEFIKNSDKNINQYTYVWQYDGITVKGDSNYLDDEFDLDKTPMLKLGDVSNPGVLYFCCPPDLLRYCNNSPNITKLFYNCGSMMHTRDYGNQWDFQNNQILEFGLKGRIPPYLLKPVYQVANLSGMFTNCKRLCYYTKNNETQFTIPETFFKYTPNITNLSETFKGLIFPNNIDLNVFGNLSKLADISKIFHMPYFISDSENRVDVRNTFPYSAHKVLSNIYGAFSLAEGDGWQNGINKTQYVTFDGVFVGHKFGEYSDKSLCSYVFAYYNGSSVEFKNKSLPTSDTFKNYITI